MMNELKEYITKKIALIFSGSDIEENLKALEEEMWKEKCIREYYQDDRESFVCALVNDITEISEQFLAS